MLFEMFLIDFAHLIFCNDLKKKAWPICICQIFQMGKLSRGLCDVPRAVLGVAIRPHLQCFFCYTTHRRPPTRMTRSCHTLVLQHGQSPNFLTPGSKNVGSGLNSGFFTHQLQGLGQVTLPFACSVSPSIKWASYSENGGD